MTEWEADVNKGISDDGKQSVKMKRIRSRSNMIFLTLVGLVFIAVNILQLTTDRNEIDYWMLFTGFPFSIFFFYMVVRIRIEYCENFMYVFYLWNKLKISYSDIWKISSGRSMGAYWIEGYDLWTLHCAMCFPFERKKLRKLFDTIKKANPDVCISVGWYQEESKTEKIKDFFKEMFKFGLFLLVASIGFYFLVMFF